jgi:hypothetical protein
MQQKFSASVQYEDFKGTIAADRADGQRLSGYLKSKNLITDDEFIMAISMSIGENYGIHKDPVYVTFYVKKLGKDQTVPEVIEKSGDSIELRSINVEMSIADFLSLFKRFEITLSNKGILENKTIISQ